MAVNLVNCVAGQQAGRIFTSYGVVPDIKSLVDKFNFSRTVEYFIEATNLFIYTTSVNFVYLDAYLCAHMSEIKKVTFGIEIMTIKNLVTTKMKTMLVLKRRSSKL